MELVSSYFLKPEGSRTHPRFGRPTKFTVQDLIDKLIVTQRVKNNLLLKNKKVHHRVHKSPPYSEPDESISHIHTPLTANTFLILSLSIPQHCM